MFNFYTCIENQIQMSWMKHATVALVFYLHLWIIEFVKLFFVMMYRSSYFAAGDITAQ